MCGDGPERDATAPASLLDTSMLAKVKYLGSFPVTGQDHASRADNVRIRLQELRANTSAKSVLLVISVAGIKVCSPDGQGVLMAHALRRISYATCEPVHAQFSFLAREPRGQLSLQYCHSFLAASPQQVGNPSGSRLRAAPQRRAGQAAHSTQCSSGAPPPRAGSACRRPQRRQPSVPHGTPPAA